MRKILMSAVLAVAATVGLASPAFAINTVDCEPYNNWLKIFHYMGAGMADTCFANAGSAPVYFARTTGLRAGNNNGHVDFIDTDGRERFRVFTRGETHTFSSQVIAIRITIY